MKHFPTLLEALKIIEIDPDIREAWVNFLHIQSVNALVAFYSQPLALWMFVPCGEDGEPMITKEQIDPFAVEPCDEMKKNMSFDDLQKWGEEEYYQRLTAHGVKYEAAQKRVLLIM